MKPIFHLGIPALFAALLIAASTGAVAQEKATRTILAEDDKVQVSEIRQKPGEISVPDTSVFRVIRAMQGGRLLRTFADGKTETSDWKTGEVQIQQPGPAYTVTNVGNTEVLLYVVRLK